MESENLVPMIIAVCIIGFIGILFFNMSQIPQDRIQAYVFTVLFAGLIFQQVWGGWLPWRSPDKFTSWSNATGRVVRHDDLPGGLVNYIVSFVRREIKGEVLKKKLGGWYWLTSFFTGTVVISIVDYQHKFKQLSTHDLDTPEGGVFYKGKLSGADLIDPDIIGDQAELERMKNVIMYLQTSMHKSESQLANLLKQGISDAVSFTSKAKVIADNMKNVKIITKGSGGGAAEVGDSLQ